MVNTQVDTLKIYILKDFLNIKAQNIVIIILRQKLIPKIELVKQKKGKM